MMNGAALSATQIDAIKVMLGLVAGDMTEEALADWLRGHIAFASS